jgi:hypothetical protein
LYLTTLLNELRLFGSHEELDQRIGWYLEAAKPFELYGKVIERWEQDYGKPDPACDNIVRESLVRIWAARRGRAWRTCWRSRASSIRSGTRASSR